MEEKKFTTDEICEYMIFYSAYLDTYIAFMYEAEHLFSERQQKLLLKFDEKLKQHFSEMLSEEELNETITKYTETNITDEELEKEACRKYVKIMIANK